MKHTQRNVRVWLHPIVGLMNFTLMTLLGSFITDQIDPMKWESADRGMLVFIWISSLIFVHGWTEALGVPRAVASMLNGEDQ